MRLWLSKNSDVPIREQLVTQLILGIVSNDLKVKQRLPSTRDLARRYDIHANTVSAAYRELAKRGWVEFRKGSGVYVRAQTPETLESDFELEQLIARFIKSTRARGYSLAEIQAGVQRPLQVQPPDQFLLVEPDVELRAILVSEIAQSTGVRVTGAGRDELVDSASLLGAVPVVLFGHFEEIRNCIAPEADLLVLNSASVAEALRGQNRPPADALVAIVSRWPEFLRWSRTMLVAAGLDGDALSFRDARESGWEKGLRSASFVITDSLMAPRMPPTCEVRVFSVIADTSLKELRDYAERFFGESCSNL